MHIPPHSGEGGGDTLITRIVLENRFVDGQLSRTMLDVAESRRFAALAWWKVRPAKEPIKTG